MKNQVVYFMVDKKKKSQSNLTSKLEHVSDFLENSFKGVIRPFIQRISFY